MQLGGIGLVIRYCCSDLFGADFFGHCGEFVLEGNCLVVLSSQDAFFRIFSPESSRVAQNVPNILGDVLFPFLEPKVFLNQAGQNCKKQKNAEFYALHFKF